MERIEEFLRQHSRDEEPSGFLVYFPAMTEEEIEAGVELLKALKDRADMTLSDAIQINPGCSERSWLNIVQELNVSGLIEHHWHNGTIRILPAGIEYLNRQTEE